MGAARKSECIRAGNTRIFPAKALSSQRRESCGRNSIVKYFSLSRADLGVPAGGNSESDLLDGVAAQALTMEFGDELADFLWTIEIADQNGIGGVDNDGIVDSQQHDQSLGRMN